MNPQKTTLLLLSLVNALILSFSIYTFGANLFGLYIPLPVLVLLCTVLIFSITFFFKNREEKIRKIYVNAIYILLSML